MSKFMPASTKVEASDDLVAIHQMIMALEEAKQYFDGKPFCDEATGNPTEERMCGLHIDAALKAAERFNL